MPLRGILVDRDVVDGVAVGRLKLLLDLVRVVSHEAPVASLVYGAAILRACAGEGAWPFVDLDAPPMSASAFANAARRGHIDAFFAGRATAVGGRRLSPVEQATLDGSPAALALLYMQSQGVVFERQRRLKGESQSVAHESNAHRAACNRAWGAGAVHGIPMRMRPQLCASFLRAVHGALAADERLPLADQEGPEWRAAWRQWTKGKVGRRVCASGVGRGATIHGAGRTDARAHAAPARDGARRPATLEESAYELHSHEWAITPPPSIRPSRP